MTIISRVLKRCGHPDQLIRPAGRLGSTLPVFLAVMALLISAAAALAQSETIITNGSDWRYLKGTSEASTPDNLWRNNGFDDSGWLPGTAPFSYGNNGATRDDAVASGTLLSDMYLNYGCVFLRKTFVVTNVAQIQAVNFATYYDDGFVAWINGAVVLLQNMSTTSPTIASLAVLAHEADPVQNLTVTNSPQSYLVAGTNTIAVQVFNNHLNSSDLRFETTLQITRSVPLVDTNPPVVSALSPSAGASVSSLTQIAVTFSEAVTNVRASDLLINGSPATGIVGTAPTNVYTFIFTQPSAGLVNMAWNGSQTIKDLSSNAFQPGAGWTYSLNGPPVVSSLTPSANDTLSSLTQITVTFSRPVMGVAASDLLINGMPASAVAGLAPASVYTFSFTQPVAGVVTAGWSDSQGISDLVGNPFQPGGGDATWSYTLVDSLAPHVSQLTPANGIRVSLLNRVEVLFDEPVQGVDASDLLVNGQPATNVIGSSAGPYLFSFPQPVGGAVQFSWAPGHGITDLAESANAFAGGDWTNNLDPAYGLPTVRINEFLVSNVDTNGLKDEFGNLEDWIELYNYGSNAVDLSGCALTDSASVPGKWVLPPVTLGAGQYLIVFASGLDRKVVGGTNQLHTSFSLTTGGEYLGLFNAESPRRVVDDFTNGYPEQRNDYSYGRVASNQWAYFASPTPGAVNGASSITGVVSEVHFTVGRGFFSQPFKLLLTTPTPGATIRYTTDGTPPTSSAGTIYASPLLITNTTILRAAAYAPDLLPTLVKTHTYLFLSGVLNQSTNPPGFPLTGNWAPGLSGSLTLPDYGMDQRIVTNPAYSGTIVSDLLSLPALSIVMNTEDMFGTNNGVYSHPASETLEAACSVEMFSPDGGEDVQIDAGVEMHGGGSRTKTSKHSLGIKFRGKYGYGKLQYPLFSDSPATTFNSLVLHADYNNHWVHAIDGSQRARGGLVRDALVKEVMGEMGAFTSHSRYVHLYINGLYWGVYNPCEAIDDNFPAPYFGGTGDDYDCVRMGDSASWFGSQTAYNTMLGYSTVGLTNATQYAQIKQYLDVQQYADYLILQHYAGNWDWGTTKNWGAFRKREPGAQFKYVPWDNERTFEGVNDNLTATSPNNLQNNLILNSEYKILFADRIHRHLFNSGALTTNRIAELWMARAGEIYGAMVGESARWGDAMSATLYTRDDHFLAEQNRLLTNYFPFRTANLVNQYIAKGYYPNVVAPEFNQFGGRVAAGFNLIISAPAGTIYYTTNGVDPRVPIAGSVSSSAIAYTGTPVTLTESKLIKARVLSGGTWSALTEAQFTVGSLGVPLRITEIMYNPVGGNAYEFLEVQNIGTASIDLGAYSFQGITYAFPPGTILPASGTLLLANGTSPADFSARYPGVVVFGWFSDNLSNGGERIAILDAGGNTVTAVNYDDENGWPIAADGGGASLEIIDPRGNPDAPANWRASSAVNGTPGLPPASPAPGSVVLNEIAADNLGSVTNGGLFPDWIEIQNRGASPTNLAGWSLSDDSNARKFVLPGTNLPAGGYLVIWCDGATGAPGLHSGFSLSKNGETISLFDSNTNRVDAVTFGLQLPDKTLGRSPTDWTLTLPTPNATNVAAALAAPASLALNEWLADPAPGGEDWLELFNTSASAPVSLHGLYLSTSNALYQMLDYSYLAPRGYVQLLADELPGPGHLDFKLPASGGAIALADQTGEEIQRVTYGAQVQTVTEGRLPDGAASLTNFPGSASPGSTNYLLTWTGPQLNEILARNDRAELTPWHAYADWVEIYNPSNVSVSLAGLAVGKSNDKSDRWTFPSGVTIPANGWLRVWCDNSHEASTNAVAALNTGFALPGDGGEVYLFNTAGQLVDFVSYGFQLEDLTIGRSGGQWVLLASPTPGAANSAPAALGAVASLRLNEWMARPHSGDDWFELYNTGALPVQLTGLFVTDNPSTAGMTQSQLGPLSFVGGRKWVELTADNHPGSGSGHVSFSLDGSGETLRLYNTNTNLIDVVDFGIQAPGASQGCLPDGTANIVSFPTTPTPGDANYLPLTNVIINEVLTHTDAPLEDAVELFNPTAFGVNIGGWFISDNASDLKRFRIPDGTVIPAGGFKVFYQYQFGPADGETDVPPLFTFNSAHGDAVYLSAADGNTNLTGERALVKFDAAANGVSFGRYQTSVGVDFVALSARTFGVDNPSTLSQFRAGTGQANAYPFVGPVVISQIMYHPPDYVTNAPDQEEFIELENTAPTNAPLFDPAFPANVWRLANAVDFTFPTNTVIPAGGRLLVVPFDPGTNSPALTAFVGRYGAGHTLVGPYSGQLANGGETIELWRPDVPQSAPHPDAGYVPQILVERVTYSDMAPWPTNADGGGASLQRVAGSDYGNDPVNWVAGYPAVTVTNVVPPVGAANLIGGGILRLTFAVQDGFTYQVEYKDHLNDADWLLLGTPVTATNDTLAVDELISAQPQRFYRLRYLH
jgi:hypothetical protein